jgi:PAS domain-containing protein
MNCTSAALLSSAVEQGMDRMAVESFMAETFLQAAVTAVQQGRDELHEALDTLPVPVYVTNAQGVITYYNQACVAFAGRTPCLGQDSWCVTWKLYTEAGQKPRRAAVG